VPTIRENARATAATQGILAVRRKIDMHEKILLLEPNAAPLTVLLSRLDRQSVYNPDFKVMKDELLPVVTAINSSAGYTATDTVLKVDNDEYFVVGSLGLFPRIDEMFRVTAISATDSTVTVGRDYSGASNNAALNDNEPIMILSDSNAEGADVGSGKSTLETSDTNYTQIIRTPFEITGTLMASDLYAGPDFPYQASKHGIQHLRKQNLVSWFGQKKLVTSGGTPIRTTGGLDEHITTNETDVGGNLTTLELVSWIRPIFRYGESSTRACFMSREVADAFSLIGLDRVEVVPETKSFGIALESWFSPHGRLNFMVENLFSDIDWLRERAYAIDLSQYGYRFLQGRDTMLRTNVQSPGVDGRKDEYLTEFGIQRGQEKSSGRLKGVQLGA
jgi:hypothetical protein